jgi:hypothetical protein
MVTFMDVFRKYWHWVFQKVLSVRSYKNGAKYKWEACQMLKVKLLLP